MSPQNYFPASYGNFKEENREESGGLAVQIFKMFSKQNEAELGHEQMGK